MSWSAGKHLVAGAFVMIVTLVIGRFGALEALSAFTLFQIGEITISVTTIIAVGSIGFVLLCLWRFILETARQAA